MADKIATMQYINDLTGSSLANPTKCEIHGYLKSLSSLITINTPYGTYSSNQCVKEKDITARQQEEINTKVTIRNFGPNHVYTLNLTFSDGFSNTATASTGGGFSNGSTRTTSMSNSTVYKKDKVSLSKVVVTAANG